MRNKILISMFALALTVFGIGCGDDDEGKNFDRFVGSYDATATVSGGGGSNTFTTTVQIQKGSTTDLLVSFLDAQNLRATITGDSTFRIDQQQTNLVNDGGGAFTATASGSGSVAGGALTMTGQISTNDGLVAFTVNGTKL